MEACADPFDKDDAKNDPRMILSPGADDCKWCKVYKNGLFDNSIML